MYVNFGRSIFLFKNLSISSLVTINIIILAVWHLIFFLACVLIRESYFNPNKPRYELKKWEDSGKWYVKNLKIKYWKDILPQHIGKNGFSKRNFTNCSIEYIDKFIMETCRGEWNHSMSCIFAIIPILINPFWVGLIFSGLTLLINLPCIAIQRYNRTRLQIIKKKIKRSKQKTIISSKEMESA